MEEKAVIVRIKGNNIKAARIIYDECRNCKKHCLKRLKPFTVSNKKRFDVKEGSTIIFENSGEKAAAAGITALLLPIAAMFASCILFPDIMKSHGFTISEYQTALFSAGVFIFFSAAIFIFRRICFLFFKPEIKKVLDTQEKKDQPL